MTREGEISVFGAERYYSLTVEDRFPEVFIGHGSKIGKQKETALHLLHGKQLSSEPDEPYSTSAIKPGFDGNEFRFDAFHGELDANMVENELDCCPSYGDSVQEDHFAFPGWKSMIGKLGERELSELSWDAIPEARRFLEDMESETSSDLFEIDTLSVSEQTLNSTQESDCGSSSITAKTGHDTEPTEVSAISGDGSAVLDGGGTKPPPGNAAQKKSTAERDFKRSKSSKLLGCKSFKAVTVVETAHRTTKTKKTKPSLKAKNMSTLKL